MTQAPLTPQPPRCTTSRRSSSGGSRRCRARQCRWTWRRPRSSSAASRRCSARWHTRGHASVFTLRPDARARPRALALPGTLLLARLAPTVNAVRRSGRPPPPPSTSIRRCPSSARERSFVGAYSDAGDTSCVEVDD
ncbi:hypothetical protein BS78_06G165400 [Paspalum vaginatum]|nr:hypothetical protein BS78_06G165400 [Paspalum vaginatum]